jgi:hypothetical protein
VQTSPSRVDTGGGAYYGGSVQAGGDIIGRDQVIHGSSLRNSRQGLQGEEIAALAASFQAVYGQIDRRAARDPDADPDLVVDTAKKIEQEASKGEDADPERVRRWLGTLRLQNGGSRV